MAWGMIVRSDGGGLSSQSLEVWRHLRPEHTLLVQFGERSRGTQYPERYEADWTDLTIINKPDIGGGALLDFARKCSTVFSIETWYCLSAPRFLRQARTRFVLLANPELYRAGRGRPPDLYVPTTWALDRMPRGTKVLPQPVARDVLPFTQRTSCDTFYHLAAPARGDRNGTQVVLAAAELIDEPCDIIIRSHHPPPTGEVQWRVGAVTIHWINGFTQNYWDAYPAEADVFVQPRRYGGLSLPVSEAASLGMPVVMSDLAPQSSWPHVIGVRAHSPERVTMQGGAFGIYQVDHVHLAQVMTDLVRSPERVADASLRSDAWATENSWDALLPVWQEALYI